jgi:hypothetical protein
MVRILRQILQRHIVLKEFGWNYLAILFHVQASGSNAVVFIEKLIEVFNDLNMALLLIVSERLLLFSMSAVSQCMITLQFRLSNILQANYQLRHMYTVKNLARY